MYLLFSQLRQIFCWVPLSYREVVLLYLHGLITFHNYGQHHRYDIYQAFMLLCVLQFQQLPNVKRLPLPFKSLHKLVNFPAAFGKDHSGNSAKIQLHRYQLEKFSHHPRMSIFARMRHNQFESKFVNRGTVEMLTIRRSFIQSKNFTANLGPPPT